MFTADGIEIQRYTIWLNVFPLSFRVSVGSDTIAFLGYLQTSGEWLEQTGFDHLIQRDRQLSVEVEAVREVRLFFADYREVLGLDALPSLGIP